MYKYTAEAYVPVPHAERITEKVCDRCGDCCRSIDAMGADILLDFGDARAILRLTDEGLHFRVDAQDAITFYGVRTLLQGSLPSITTFLSEEVEWYPAGSAPFDAMRGYVGTGHNW